MKKLILILCIIVFALSAFISRSKISSIYGSIEPADAAKQVWAIKGKDTLTVVPGAGKFSIAVSPGTWKIVVEAVKPYKDAVIDNIRVDDGIATDAGIIRLSSQ